MRPLRLRGILDGLGMTEREGNRRMDPRLLMSRMTEGEEGKDDRKGKAGTTRSFTSFRMTIS